MISYIRCCNCGHQWKVAGNISHLECSECSCTEIDMEMGGSKPPKWWRGE